MADRTKLTLASMKFFDVDDFKMEGFNHQNAIFGLTIEQKTREEGPTPYFAVDFAPSFGMGASFTCLRIEITEATAGGDRRWSSLARPLRRVEEVRRDNPRDQTKETGVV